MTNTTLKRWAWTNTPKNVVMWTNTSGIKIRIINWSDRIKDNVTYRCVGCSIVVHPSHCQVSIKKCSIRIFDTFFRFFNTTEPHRSERACSWSGDSLATTLIPCCVNFDLSHCPPFLSQIYTSQNSTKKGPNYAPKPGDLSGAKSIEKTPLVSTVCHSLRLSLWPWLALFCD